MNEVSERQELTNLIASKGIKNVSSVEYDDGPIKVFIKFKDDYSVMVNIDLFLWYIDCHYDISFKCEVDWYCNFKKQKISIGSFAKLP